MTTTLVNLCPYTIAIISDEGEPLYTVQPSGSLARVTQNEEMLEIPGLPCKIIHPQFGKVKGLPPAKPGVFFIVSRLVAAASPDRTDLLIPGPLIRDKDGNPIRWCRELSII